MMRTDDRNNPLYPVFEADKCLYFRRNHDILLGPLCEILYYASYIGHYICRMDYHINRRMDPSALIQLTLAGEGELRYKNARYPLRPGSCMLIDTRVEHEFFPTAEGWEFKYVHFWGGNTSDYLSFMASYDPVRTLGEEEISRTESALDWILDETEAESIDNYPALSSKIYSLLMLIMTHDRQTTEKMKSENVRAIPHAIEYIRKNYSRKISTSEIAHSLNLSRSSLFEIFHQTYGMSPHEYIIQYRLSIAKTLLQNTALSISEIAEQTGFRDIFAFSRRFKERVGVSPKEFRQGRRLPEPPAEQDGDESSTGAGSRLPRGT